MIGRAISHYKILEKSGDEGVGIVFKVDEIFLTTIELVVHPEHHRP